MAAVHRISIISGTRPEILKLAPVYAALAKRPEIFAPTWIATGQHSSLADQAFADFGVKPDMTVELKDVPADVSAQVGATVAALAPALVTSDPELVIVQGDTSSALAGALAAAARGIPVAHVEAGLRSFDFDHPNPEESIRVIIARLAQLHFAPTENAAANLRAEGFADRRIHVTGNTVVDALMSVLPTLPDWPETLEPPQEGKRLVLVTTHRRESWGNQIEGIARAVASISDAVPDAEVILPVHPNPVVRDPLADVLGAHPRVRLTPPLAYGDFVSVLRRSSLVLTDSGGVQEEAATLGVPTLVMRKVTERTEALDAGVAKLVGTDRDDIETLAIHLLTHEADRQIMAQSGNPFGDGKAGERIASLLAREVGALRVIRGDETEGPDGAKDGTGRRTAS